MTIILLSLYLFKIEIRQLLRDLKEQLSKKTEETIKQVNEAQQYMNQSKEQEKTFLQNNHDIVEFILIMALRNLNNQQIELNNKSKEIFLLLLSELIQYLIPEDKNEIIEKVQQTEQVHIHENYLLILLKQIPDQLKIDSKFSYLYFLNQLIIKMLTDIQMQQCSSEKLNKLLQEFIFQFYTIEVDEKKISEIKESSTCFETQLSRKQFQQYEKIQKTQLFAKYIQFVQLKTIQYKQQPQTNVELLNQYLTSQIYHIIDIKLQSQNIVPIFPAYYNMIKTFLNVKTQHKSQFISDILTLYTTSLQQLENYYHQQGEQVLKKHQITYNFSYIQLASLNYEWAVKSNSTIKYKQTINMMKHISKLCLQNRQMFSVYFEAYDNIILKLIENGENEQLRYLAAQFIVWQFCSEENSNKLNIFANAFDLEGIPFISETFTTLLKASNQETKFQKNIITTTFPTIKISDLINNLYKNIDCSKKYNLGQNTCTSMTDICFMVLLRLLRLFKNDDLNNYQNPELDKWYKEKETFIQFNECQKASKALDLLIQSNICDNQPNNIAFLFIQNNQFLNKQYIGEILGGNNDLSQQILASFSDIVISNIVNADQSKDVAKMFSNSLRAFLSLFRMPGEGQLIDRIISQFSKTISKYTSFNYDTIYILSFATIMLNTDMHNVHVKTKMTMKEFITNIYRADKQKQLSEQFLCKLYKEIQSNPFTLDEVEEQRALGLDGVYGLFEYYAHKLYDEVQVIEKEIIGLSSIDQTTDYTDENQLSISEFQSSITTPKAATMCQDLAVFCSPSQQQQQSRELQIESLYSSDDEQQNESSKQQNEPQQSTAKTQTDTDELSVAPLSVCLTQTQRSTQELSTIEQDNEQLIQQLVQYQNAHVYVLKLYIVKIKDRILQYYYNHLVKQNRYSKLSEICIQTYRCLIINENYVEYRSQLIDIITLLPHIVLQQYFYNSSQTVKQFQKVIQNITILDGTDLFPDDLVKLQKSIMDDFITSVISLVFIGDTITHESRRQFLSMFFNLLTFSQVCSFDKQNRRDYDQFMFQFDNSLDQPTKVRLDQYQTFYIYVQKRIDQLQQFIDETGQEKMKIQNASILLQLNALQTVQDLLYLLPYHLTQNSLLIDSNQFKTQYQFPLQYGILIILQKISTELYTQIINVLQLTNHIRLDSDSVTNKKQQTTLDEQQVLVQQQQLKQQIIALYGQCNENSVFQWLNLLFIQELNTLINIALDVDQFTDNYIQFQSIAIQHVQKLVAKYVSTFQYFNIKSEKVFSDMLLILSHSVSGIKSLTALTTLIETFLTQFSMINTSNFNRYQDCMPFIIQMCLKIENNPSKTNTCQELYHQKCNFQRDKLYILKHERKLGTQQFSYNQQILTIFYTILSALCNRIHMLSQENICQFHNYPLILLSKTNAKTVQETVIDMLIQTADRLLDFSCLEIVEFAVRTYETVLQNTVCQKDMKYINEPLIQLVLKIYKQCLAESQNTNYVKQERINAANTIYDNVLQPIISQQQSNDDNSVLNQLVSLLITSCDDQTFADIFQKLYQQTFTFCQVKQHDIPQFTFYIEQVFMKLFKKFVIDIKQFQDHQQTIKDSFIQMFSQLQNSFINNLDYLLVIQKHIIKELIYLYSQNQEQLEQLLISIIDIEIKSTDELFKTQFKHKINPKYFTYLSLLIENNSEIYKLSKQLNNKTYQFELMIHSIMIQLLHFISDQNRVIFKQEINQLYQFTQNNQIQQIKQIYSYLLQYIQSQDQQLCQYLITQLNNFQEFFK